MHMSIIKIVIICQYDILYILYHHQLLFRNINRTNVACANLSSRASIIEAELHLFSS